MKYSIPLYFILFISIITIINVNSAKKPPKKPTTKEKKIWKPLKVPLNGTLVTKLGKKGVDYYNKQHNKTLIYINVTSGERCGHLSSKNKKIRVTVLVGKTSNGKKGSTSCNHLRAVFNVTKKGGEKIILVKLLKTNVTGNCNIKGKDKASQKTTKKPTTKKNSKGKKN
ncbi:Hypothetical protein SRAE_2000499810 [Strongyloides ratti]|uniref:Uncharacterized protein n=1 Tax=Strongyloides ratti TaxID=34506 RepID=A0A090N6B7_STRRB|nr:Hypothetical protein SRAE_2000499810 [Strongyloides ratti]CEG06145.1 Hypothetical protein SRAE_2000499810 [Strongyloides ratti]